MAEITFKVHPKHRVNEEYLVKRIAHICYGYESFCEEQNQGYKWSLNIIDNMWWTSGIEKDDNGNLTMKVAYRYGGGERNQAALEAIKTFLEWKFGPYDD